MQRVERARRAQVLNGIHFRTRHNDYSMVAPVRGTGVDREGNNKFNLGEDIEWPPVPPDVEPGSATQRPCFEALEGGRKDVFVPRA